MRVHGLCHASQGVQVLRHGTALRLHARNGMMHDALGDMPRTSKNYAILFKPAGVALTRL
jgi:hypothetical protein